MLSNGVFSVSLCLGGSKLLNLYAYGVITCITHAGSFVACGLAMVALESFAHLCHKASAQQ
jgi:hypothetical protein